MSKLKIDRVTKAKLDDIILQGKKDDDPVKSFCLDFVFNDQHECWITTTYQSGKTDDERYFDITMNQLAIEQLPFEGGCIVLPADYESVIDPNIVDNFACWSKTYTLDLSDIGILTDKESKTCYSNKGMYCGYEECKDRNYIIYEFEDVLLDE